MTKRKEPGGGDLKSWQQIADYLHKPLSTIHRWAREGMPVRREGRHVIASPHELSQWFAKEMGTPLHVSEPGEDLLAELKKAVTSARKQHRRIA